MSNKTKKALKSYQFWLSASAFILLVLNTSGVKVVAEQYNNLVTGLLGLLVMVGVLHNEPPDDTPKNNTPPDDEST